MAQYKVGTVDVTNGSATVTGNSTSFLATVSVGDAFTVTGTGFFYDIASVDSDTQITLSAPYQGVTETTTYTIARDFTPLNNIVELKQGDIETGAIFTRAMRKIDQQLSLNQDAGALTSAGVYSSTSAGISGTTSGDYFFVPESDEFVLYLNSGGSAVEQVRFASLATALQYATDAQNAASAAAADAAAASTDADDADTAAIEAEGFSQAAEGSATSAEDSATASADSAAASAQSATDASDDADRAEAARDAAEFNGGIYPDTTEGLLNTVDGNYFSTPNADADVYLDLYRNDAGSATLIASYPSKAFLEAVEARVATNEGDIGTNVSDITALKKVNTREELLREATLTADFANNLYEVYEGITDGLTERPFNDVFDFTRGSKAIGKTATNKLQEAIADAHRLVGNREGLMIEEERTNLLEYPRRFDQSAWSPSRASVTPNSFVGPDGKLSASKLALDAGESNGLIQQTVTVSGNIVSGVVAKAGEWDYVGVYNLTTTKGATFNLSNGTYGDDIAGTPDDFFIKPLGNGWYFVGIVDNFSGSLDLRIYSSEVAEFNSNAGDGTSGIYIWHAQLEEGSFPTSPIVPNTAFTSRDSIATALNSEGTLSYFSVDVARDDAYGYDSDGILRPIGLLLEDSSENVFLYSEDLNGADWTILAGTITADDTAAPDDAVTADLWTSDNATDGHRAQQNFTLTSGNTYTLSGYVKENGVQFIEIVIGGAYTTSSTYAIFDVINGTVTTSAQGDGVVATIEPAKNGFYRIALTFDATASGSGNSAFSFVDSGTAGYAPNYTGDGVKGAYIWGAQLEESPYATSYTGETLGTAVIRAADVSSSSASTRAADDCVRAFGQELNIAEFTIYADAETFGANDENRTFFYFGLDGGTQNRLLIDFRNNGNIRFFYSLDNAVVHNDDIVVGQNGGKVAFSYDGENFIAAANGVSITLAVPSAVPANWKTLLPGRGNTDGSYLNGQLKDLRTLPRALTASELETLTGGN